MSLLQAIALGLVQGLTEFLPVSSSGHLVIGATLFGLDEPAVAFDTLVHGGTLVAVLVYFRHRILRLIVDRSWSYLGKIVAGTIPAAVVGLAFESRIEQAFDIPWLVVFALLGTGALLLSLQALPESREEVQEPSWLQAWWIGCAQMVSLLPGVSRSGSTIVTARWLGLAPAAAAEFSFLLGVPAIAGAVLLQAGDLRSAAAVGSGFVFFAGWAAALLAGLIAIALVFHLLAHRAFRLFGWYCWAVAGAFAIWLWVT